jgi:hypothetical protein
MHLKLEYSDQALEINEKSKMNDYLYMGYMRSLKFEGKMELYLSI